MKLPDSQRLKGESKGMLVRVSLDKPSFHDEWFRVPFEEDWSLGKSHEFFERNLLERKVTGAALPNLTQRMGGLLKI